MMQGSREIFEPDHFTHSFALQYIALILFILIFTISSFISKPLKNSSPVAPVVNHEKSAVNNEIVLTQIQLSNIFSGTSLKEQDGIPGVIALLKEHDVEAKIKLYWGDSIGLPTALRRGDHLVKEILSEGIPAGSVHVLVEKNNSKTQGEIIVSRMPK